MQHLFFPDNKFEAPVFIIICLVLLQYWAPTFKNQDMTNNLGTMVGSAVMVTVLVLYLTDLDVMESILFGVGYFVVFWLLTNYTTNFVAPQTSYQESFQSDAEIMDDASQLLINLTNDSLQSDTKIMDETVELLSNLTYWADDVDL